MGIANLILEENMNSDTLKFKIEIDAPPKFNLAQTLNCGQCFRFYESGGRHCGVVLDKYIEIAETDGKLTICSDKEITEDELCSFFDFTLNYDEINAVLSQDETMKSAIEYAGGIRILRQNTWEVLCSFILSQNNNIKRIAGIIERLCENFGDDIGNGHYSFPDASRIAALSVEDLAPIRSGFRAKYVIDAAKKVCSGEVNINELFLLDTESAREVLMKINGVGPKVADCVLLFGFHKLDAFPKDVWIKKALSEFYPDGVPDFIVKYGGIAQQYLFHYIRTKLN